MSQADVICWLLVIGDFTTATMTIMNVCIQNIKLDFIILYFYKLFIMEMTEYLFAMTINKTAQKLSFFLL